MVSARCKINSLNPYFSCVCSACAYWWHALSHHWIQSVLFPYHYIVQCCFELKVCQLNRSIDIGLALHQPFEMQYGDCKSWNFVGYMVHHSDTRVGNRQIWCPFWFSNINQSPNEPKCNSFATKQVHQQSNHTKLFLLYLLLLSLTFSSVSYKSINGMGELLLSPVSMAIKYDGNNYFVLENFSFLLANS